VIIIITVLASAFWSAQHAEKDRKKRLVDFLGGLFIPWLYPLFIYRSTISSKKNTIDTNTSKMKEELTDDEKKANLFAKIAINEEGTPQGPFNFNLTDNSTIKVKHITAVKNNLIIVDAITPSGKIKKIRIPYSQIKSYSSQH